MVTSPVGSKVRMAIMAIATALATVQSAASTGYAREWTSPNASADGDGYISSYADTTPTSIQDFTIQCAASCDSSSSCVFFNVYQELSDQPPANICVLWYQDKALSSATNTFNNGKPISNSVGYSKTSTVTTPPNYRLEWSTPNAAATGPGYISSFVSSQSVFYNDLVQECASACDATTACEFYNVYQEVESSPASNVCVLWNQDKPSSSATNTFNNGRPVSNSNGYVKETASTTTTMSSTSTAFETSSTVSTSTTSSPTSVSASGYSIEWTSENAAADGPGYLSSYVSQTDSYSDLVADCAGSCTAALSCVFFNVYQELSDQPPANICVLWNQDKSVSSATNVYNNGKPISNSTGYSQSAITSTTTTSDASSSTSPIQSTTTTDIATSTTADESTTTTSSTIASSTTTDTSTSTTMTLSETTTMDSTSAFESTATSSASSTSSIDFVAPTNVPGYTQQWTSDDAAADGDGFIRAFVLPSTTSYSDLVTRCASACTADISCAFINTYQDMDNSGDPSSNVCVLWNQNKSEASATNVYNSGRPIMNSVGYSRDSISQTTNSLTSTVDSTTSTTSTTLTISTTSSTPTTTSLTSSTSSTTSSMTTMVTSTTSATSTTTTTSSSTSVNAPQVTQVVVNSGFESGSLPPWTSSGTVGVDGTSPRSGAYGALFYTMAINQPSIVQPVVSLIPGRFYRIAYYAYKNSDASCTAVIFLNGQNIQTSPALVSSYTYYNKIVQVSSASATLGLQATCGNSTGTVYVDDITMTLLPLGG